MLSHLRKLRCKQIKKQKKDNTWFCLCCCYQFDLDGNLLKGASLDFNNTIDLHISRNVDVDYLQKDFRCYQTVARKVHITGEKYTAKRKKTSKILQALTMLPHLHTLEFHQASSPGHSLLPAKAMASLMQDLSSLQKLCFHSCDVFGSEAEIDRFWNSIGQHPALEHLEVQWCCIGFDQVHLMTVASCLQRLKHLRVDSLDNWEPKTQLVLLESCLLLEELELKGMWFSGEEFTELVHCLHQQKHLRCLTLGKCYNMDTSGHDALVQLLQGSKDSLEEFEFQPDDNGFGESIHFLSDTVPRALAPNQHLKKMVIIQRPAAEEAWKSFELQIRWLELVRDHNMVLENLRIEDCNFPNRWHPDLDLDPSLQRALEFYLRLNQLGRGRVKRYLWSSETPAVFFQTLAEASDDISCLYYFLRLGPSICNVVFSN